MIMKKLLLLIGIITTSLYSVAEFHNSMPPWQKPFAKRIPSVYAWNAQITPASQTGTGYDDLDVGVALYGWTDNYWSIATISIYCYYWHSGFPSGHYGWGYKTWTAEVPPNSMGGDTHWMLSGEETFNRWFNDPSMVNPSDMSLVSYEQE